MPIVLMSAGIVCFIVGLIMQLNSPKEGEKEITHDKEVSRYSIEEAKMPQSSIANSGSVPDVLKTEENGQSATEGYRNGSAFDDAKEKGNQFENYVANLFKDKKLFKVLEWNQGQTSSEGVYAENDKNPDFKIKQDFKKSGLTYWVECKFRSKTNDGNFTIADYQLKRYRKIQAESRLKVFVAIGFGGSPSNPEMFYLVPLDSLKSSIINVNDINQFKINHSGQLFYDCVQDYFQNKVFKKKSTRTSFN